MRLEAMAVEFPHVDKHPNRVPFEGVLTVVNAGKHDVVVLGDGWTAVTADGSMSAHFEHTVAVPATGARVLTE